MPVTLVFELKRLNESASQDYVEVRNHANSSVIMVKGKRLKSVNESLQIRSSEPAVDDDVLRLQSMVSHDLDEISERAREELKVVDSKVEVSVNPKKVFKVPLTWMMPDSEVNVSVRLKTLDGNDTDDGESLPLF